MRQSGHGRYSQSQMGNFILGRLLGQGAMGEVYEAVHCETGARAAVKVVLTEALHRPGMLERFQREVEITADLGSDNIVAVYESSRSSFDLPYLVMELLEGEDLANYLAGDEPLTVADVIDLVRQVGRGLAAAASRGIVHRDIKPNNLFRTREGVWKILDFGVSKLRDSSGTLTEGRVVGTPSYMAPEQARDGDVTPRADLYSLGAIAYKCLTRRPAFPQGELGAVLYAVVYEMPIRPSSLAPLPPQIDTVLAIALAKEPEARFASGAAFADALEAAVAGALPPELAAHGERLMSAWPWR